MIRVAGAVILANLLRLARDRVGLAFIVAIPFLLIAVIGATMPEDGSARPVGLLVVAPGERADAVAQALADEATLEPVRYASEDEVRGAVRRGRVGAGVIVRATDGHDVSPGASTGATDVRVLTDPSRPPDAAVRAGIDRAVRTAALAQRSADFVAAETGLDGEAAAAATRSLPDFGGTEVHAATVGSGNVPATTGTAFVAPAYLVLFLFINTLVAAWGLPADRASGLARRMRATPAGTPGLVLGEAGYRYLVALLQAAVIIGVGSVAFGVQWGDPLAVFAIVALFAWVATAFAMALGSLVRTADQATSIAPPLGIALGMLGGCMWPLETAAPALQTIGRAIPHAWAVSGFQQVVGAGAGVAGIATELSVLAAFAAGATAVAWIAFGRRSV